MSLGGVRDEAEIRGHRRTYIGALPGQIIQMMKKAGTRNPVFMLDEVDKMSMDFRGDPSAALLEVLDPEQNYMFVDHYLDVEYDLCQVFFIATANVLHTIPPALQDRMEVIRLSGYTELGEAGDRQAVPGPQADGSRPASTDKNIEFTDEGLQALIQFYTREAGVRNLEREIGNVCRKVARKVVNTISAAKRKRRRPTRLLSNPTRVPELLGPQKFRDLQTDKQNEIGAAVGLAWTEVGGSILTTEATIDGRQRQADHHRQTRRRDAGVGAGGHELYPVAGAHARAAAGFLSQSRHPRARTRGRDSEGRSLGRHYDCHEPSPAR